MLCVLDFVISRTPGGGAKKKNCGIAPRIAEQKTKGLHEESHASP